MNIKYVTAVVLSAIVAVSVLSGCEGQKVKNGKNEITKSDENNTAANAQNKIPDFTAKDLDGNIVTNDIFYEKDLTVVNVWGTFCGPCIAEMPELGEWARALPDNVQIVGLIADIEGENDIEHINSAKDITSKANADFLQIIANSDFTDLMNDIVGVPTTLFIDKNGNYTGKPVVGADVEAYKSFVEKYINEQS